MNTPTNIERSAETEPKVAIVTGASRGIGAEIATRLAADGFVVIVNFAREQGAADELVAKIAANGGRALAVQADVRAPNEVRRLFETAERTFGGVDVLVNNAGLMITSPVAEMDDADFDRMVAVNLKGTFNAMREAAKRLRSGGRVINLSSTVIGLQLPSYAPYAATKGAVEAMTPILAKEMRGRKITVNTVAPGPTATELYFEGKPAEVIERAAKAAPLERLGQPKDVANVVAFLVSEEGGWVNGQTVRVNGGVV
jgi:3-oxoacyl-[acyl-carrier protein] reductase